MTSSELNKKLKPIFYQIEEKDDLILKAVENQSKVSFGYFFIAVGVLRLFMGRFVSALISIIGGALWIQHVVNTDRKLNKLNRKDHELTINSKGIIIRNRITDSMKFYEEEKISDLIIEESSEINLDILTLKGMYQDSESIEILKCVNGKEAKKVLKSVANIVLNIWDEGQENVNEEP